MDRMDRNRDGKLSKQEFRGPTRVFTDMDADNYGYVTRKDMRAFDQKRNGGKRMFLEKTDEGPYPDLVVKKYDKNKA